MSEKVYAKLPVKGRTYSWARRIPLGEWLDLWRTFSIEQRMGNDVKYIGSEIFIRVNGEWLY